MFYSSILFNGFEMTFVRRLRILHEAAVGSRMLLLLCAASLSSILFIEQHFRRLPDLDDFEKPVFHNPCYGWISADLRRLWSNVSRNSVFQPIGGIGSRSYVYSAYIDDRQGMLDVSASANDPIVRLFGLVDRKHKQQINDGTWYCLFWNKRFRLIHTSTVIKWTELNEFEAWRGDRVPPVMLVCRLPVLDCPVGLVGHCAVAVSLVSVHCQKPTNLVQLVDLPTARRTGSRLDNPRPLVKFAICPKAFYAGDTADSIEDFVESIEVNRMFGAEQFHFYLEEAAVGEKIRKCIAKYEDLGIIHTVPWTIPADISSNVPWHGQYMTMTECVYRMMYRTKYYIHQDIDEFIVPKRTENWNEMIALIDAETAVEKNGTSGDQWIASYSFLNRFFPLDWSDTINDLSPDIREQLNLLSQNKHKFRTLSWTRAEDRTYQRIERSKAMGRPERILQYYVHMVLDKHIVAPGTKNQLVEEKDALLHHYRRPLEFGWAAPVNKTRMLDFAPKIIKRLEQRLAMCRSNL